MRIDHIALGFQKELAQANGGPRVLPNPPAAGAGDPHDHPDTLYPLPPLSSAWIDKLIFLGTGTSGQVPAIHCITHEDVDERDGGFGANVTCAACADALKYGEASRNRRKCTSALVVGGKSKGKGKSAAHDDQLTILIDCGPTFYSSAIYCFPRYNLRRIDAVLLTHAHADALLGLDHLRAWTIGHMVQKYVDVYLTQETMSVVENMFPYLVDRSKATGGGGVGALRWHIIDPNKKFTIGRGTNTVDVMPLPVLHGFVNRKDPFAFVGFRIAELSYISDCHEIPDATSKLVEGSKVLVIDALKWERHTSHFSIAQALQYSLSIRDLRLALLTDLTHMVEHWDLSAQLQDWERGMRDAAALVLKRGELLQGRWWSPYWDENASEYDRHLSLSRGPPPALPSGDIASVALPIFRVAYDEQAVIFER
ncbi:hypothetical protein K437DRAFT_259954 [Tilletiaria anomala UBC 951]|uniref:Metallo-beta-lactamase domain-containing protein n=1 Tax=Tilletiaria anomala (strain ATCC 24038 / CBS 436.72 / UBC 951) TaxID=1037660 RepID=A0A066V9Q5_TILAU|nr:uncharacterized protein K437DRAFT_259954 [Tilletiaria anomala UBC 951]KDN37023.1 hypothetical protein K437DRAFT_259954 [Tilletiaria anomala UBC 951]